MTTYRIRFEGAPSSALGIATALADAQGVELTASEPPVPIGDGAVALAISVDGSLRDVAGAVDRIRSGLPAGASIRVED